MTEAAGAAGSVERDDLARTISVVGLSISQAADELQQAAERLSAAEERARAMDARVVAAEEQVGEQAARVAEMLSLLQHARDAQLEAEERARELDQANRREAERAQRAEEELKAETELAETSGERLASAEERLSAAEQQVAAAEERAVSAEQQVAAAEERTRSVEAQVQELLGRLAEAERKPNVTVILDDERTALQEAVAAEVRRPLTSILGITLALKHADASSVDGREMIRQLATNARKLDRLVGQILSIDRIAAGTFTPNLRRTDLEALVRRVVDESPDLANRDVAVQADHVAIQVDPGLTEQIVEALLANAGRRTVPGSSVWVSIASEDGGAVIAVDDTGPEIPASLRTAIFAAAGDDEATGRARGPSGLSLLSRLADIQGGRCWVEERAAEGASFRVFLPDGATERREDAEVAEQVEDEHPELMAADEQDEELAV